MSQNLLHHEEIYRGPKLKERLAKHKIVICGAGAVGSNVIDSLARIGFSNLVVIDDDRVEPHNINTQIYTSGDIGQMKGAACHNKVFDISQIEIEAFNKRLDAKNIKKAMKGATLVIDGFDNTKSRQLVKDYCHDTKTPCLHVGLFENYGEVVWNEVYVVPQDNDEDVCDYPLTRTLVMIIVGVACEEIVKFCLDGKGQESRSFTLGDCKIVPYL